jgi:ribosome-associated protein
VPQDLTLASGVVVPGRALQVRAVRSSGAGGQNVNKVSSKVELYVDLSGIEGLPPGALHRLRGLVAGRLAADGRAVLRSQLTRDQHRNVEDAYAKLRQLIERALIPPKIRRPTRSTAGARERRLTGKKVRSAIKRFRRGPHDDD